MTPWARALAELTAAGPWTSVALRVEQSGRLVWQGAAGAAQGPDQVFDLASITKPFVATALLRVVEAGDLELDQPLAEVPGKETDAPLALSAALGRRTVGELLRHRAGLLPWVPLYALTEGPRQAVARLLGGEWLGGRRGTYSDLSYILAGVLLEHTTGRALGEIFAAESQDPLAATGAHFRTRATPGAPSLASPIDTDQEVRLAAGLGLEIEPLGPPRSGQVQDGNARFLGPAGHAGLFGTVTDVAGLVGCWTEAPATGGANGALRPATVDRALRGPPGRYALGWERRRTRGEASPFRAGSFGHTGFVGGSVWHDPGPRVTVVLLGYRESSEAPLHGWRRRFYRHVLGALGVL